MNGALLYLLFFHLTEASFFADKDGEASFFDDDELDAPGPRDPTPDPEEDDSLLPPILKLAGEFEQFQLDGGDRTPVRRASGGSQTSHIWTSPGSAWEDLRSRRVPLRNMIPESSVDLCEMDAYEGSSVFTSWSEAWLGVNPEEGEVDSLGDIFGWLVQATRVLVELNTNYQSHFYVANAAPSWDVVEVGYLETQLFANTVEAYVRRFVGIARVVADLTIELELRAALNTPWAAFASAVDAMIPSELRFFDIRDRDIQLMRKIFFNRDQWATRVDHYLAGFGSAEARDRTILNWAKLLLAYFNVQADIYELQRTVLSETPLVGIGAQVTALLHSERHFGLVDSLAPEDRTEIMLALFRSVGLLPSPEHLAKLVQSELPPEAVDFVTDGARISKIVDLLLPQEKAVLYKWPMVEGVEFTLLSRISLALQFDPHTGHCGRLFGPRSDDLLLEDLRAIGNPGAVAHVLRSYFPFLVESVKFQYDAAFRRFMASSWLSDDAPPQMRKSQSRIQLAREHSEPGTDSEHLSNSGTGLYGSSNSDGYGSDGSRSPGGTRSFESRLGNYMMRKPPSSLLSQLDTREIATSGPLFGQDTLSRLFNQSPPVTRTAQERKTGNFLTDDLGLEDDD